jgi:hypothetical protein
VKITPKDWREFQHYKDRSPPWIRLHKKLLDNFEFHCLPVASKALAPMLWLLASDSLDGEIDASADKLAFRLRMTAEEIEAALKPLIELGFFVVTQSDSKPLAPRLQSALPETEAEALQKLPPRPTAKPAWGFDAFYAAYPRKVKPKDARKAWDKLRPDAGLQARILKAIEAQKSSPQWLKDGGQFIPYPATWLNDGEWDNEVAIGLVDAGATAASRAYEETQRLLSARDSIPVGKAPAELLALRRQA